MRLLLILLIAPFALLLLIPLGALAIGLGAGLIGAIIGILGAIFGVIVAFIAAVFGGMLAIGFFKGALILFLIVIVALLVAKRHVAK